MPRVHFQLMLLSCAKFGLVSLLETCDCLVWFRSWEFVLWCMQGRKTRRKIREKEGIWFPRWSLEQISEGWSMITHFVSTLVFSFYSSWLVASQSMCNLTAETFYHLLVTCCDAITIKSAIKFCLDHIWFRFLFLERI